MTVKVTGYEQLKQQQAESALRADTEGVFGPSNMEMGAALAPEILRYIEQRGQTTAADIYQDLECDDIPMYLALRSLVGGGYIVGPDPYGTWAPNDHREMVYVSKPLYWLLNGQARQGWGCTRHDNDPGLWHTVRKALPVLLAVVIAAVVLLALESACHAATSTQSLVESVSMLPTMALAALAVVLGIPVLLSLAAAAAVKRTTGHTARLNRRGRTRALVAVVALVGAALLYSSQADATPKCGTDVADTVRATDGDPTGAVKAPRRTRKFRNPALRRYAVRSDRWYSCDKNKHGLWVCTIRLETLMSGKHPTCQCVTQRSNGRMYSRCWCTQ
jgi:hypothetical protein